MKTGLSLSILLGILLASACSTTGSRIKQQEGLFGSYPAATQEAIKRGEVQVGFTEEMVKMALGKPSNISTQATTDGELAIWSYSKKRPGVGFSIGGGFGGSSSVGGGVGIGTPARQSYTYILDLVDGRVTRVQRFSD